MLTSRERVTKTLTFSNPDRAPRDLWALPYISLFRQDELDSLRERYPMDIGVSQLSPGWSDAINAQLFTMNIESLSQQYKGKFTFWGEIDRQKILPFGTPADVKQAVHRVRSAFDDGTGGVIAQCEWGKDNPKENIEAVFAAWEAS